VRWLAQSGIETGEDEVIITTGCQLDGPDP
jgi:hypothetical protein